MNYKYWNFRSAVPARTQQHAPAPQHQPTQVAPAQPQQPGLFAQMAATAGGVAVGSAIVRLLIFKFAYSFKLFLVFGL